jgi:hypothetical protein
MGNREQRFAGVAPHIAEFLKANCVPPLRLGELFPTQSFSRGI